MNIKSENDVKQLDEIKFSQPPGLHSDYSFFKNKTAFGYQYYSKLEEQGRIPKSPLMEAILVAKKISDATKDIPNLCLSSGIDSQCLLQSFLDSGVRFKATILKFKNNLNTHDTNFIIERCSSHKIPFTIVDLDIINFFESGKFFEYGKKYQCQSPQLAAHLWLYDQIDGIPICSGNFTVPIQENNNIFWVGFPGDLHGCLFRYFIQNNRSGEPWFFLNASELAGSFLNLKALKDYSQLKFNKVDDEYALRCAAYKEGGFNITPQPMKTTGFEFVREYYDSKLGTHSGIGFDAIFREPLEKLNPLAYEFIQMVPKSFTESQKKYLKAKPLIKMIRKYI